MKRMLCVSLMITAGSALAADVTYTEPPADTSLIRVEGGMTTVAGLEAYSHLTHYWSFDDENDPYADSVGNLPLAAGKSGNPQWKSVEDGAKRGGAMWASEGFRTTNFIDGQHPFTICFWYKYGASCGGQDTLVYIGQVPKSETAKCETPYLRLSQGNKGATTISRFYLWENQFGNISCSQISAFNQDEWHHIALTCEVCEYADGVVSNSYTAWFDGVSKLTLHTLPNVFDETDRWCLGAGCHYNGSSKNAEDGTFDEVMCFDRALTSEEIQTFAAYSAPVDFSAGWDIAADGTLDIFGREPLTALKGEGVAKTLETTRLEASSNAWFAGSVQSPAFAFAGEASVTQTLSGANAWTGATTVESGTLEIAASPVELFGDALVAWYPFEDATNPGRDFSPRGNNLTVPSACKFDVSSEGGVGLGQAIFLTNNTTQTGFYSSGCLKGLTSSADNSYTVSFWMRTDKWVDSAGPFQFATGGVNPAASGLITKTSATSIRYGDSGGACSTTLPFTWGDKTWHHIAVVFDSAAAKQGQVCHYCFVDGVCLHKASTYNANIANHAATAFYVGRGFSGGGPVFSGALDEMVVLNTCDTNDVAKLYALRRTQPETATGVLPTGTAVTVEEGATLKLTAANETVAQLFGKGTIDLSGNSKLTVTTKDRFDGTVIGGEITDEPGAGRPGLMILVK